jgi:hypothetical protein
MVPSRLWLHAFAARNGTLAWFRGASARANGDRCRQKQQRKPPERAVVEEAAQHGVREEE